MSISNEFRPRKFSQVIGQPAITNLLLAQSKRKQYHHSYLFAGDSGTGKTTTARILAMVLNCESPRDGEPCGVCQSCKQAVKGFQWDILEIDAARFRGIDSVKDFVQKSYYSGFSPHKIFIFDECHALTKEAWDAMLRMLEEPPPHLVIILCTTNPEALPKTIISRCQTYHFEPLSDSDIIAKMRMIMADKAISSIEDDTLQHIANFAAGNMRQAENALEQAMVLAN